MNYRNTQFAKIGHIFEVSEEEPMKRFASHGLLVVVTLVLTAFASAQNKGKADSANEGVSGTIEGLVRDIACPIQNKETAATKFNLDCALQCAKQGSPLIILTKSVAIYTPISDSMPDNDQRPRLMPFVGKYVKATGQLFERGGAHGIAIKEITEMKDVRVITGAK
jgi:hypothetical protein